MHLKFHKSCEHPLKHIRVCIVTSTMTAPVEKWPQLSVLSTLSSGTVLDAVKVSNSEEVSNQDTASDVMKCEESFCFSA